MMHKERIWDIKEYNSQMADYLAEELKYFADGHRYFIGARSAGYSFDA